MRLAAFLLFCALSSTAVAQTADQTLLPVLNRLSAYERDLRALTDTVVRLQRRLDGLDERVQALERKAAAPSTESPEVPTAEEAGVPVAEADGVVPPGVLPGGDVLAQYKQGLNLMRQARFQEAEQVFTRFLEDFPEHELANNARHWLARSFAGQAKHGEAAQQFLLAYEKDPEGSKAPDNLLKLSKAFAADGKPGEACIALSLLARKHGQAPPAVIADADVERRRLNC